MPSLATAPTTNRAGSPNDSAARDKTIAHLPLAIATAGALYFGLKLLILVGGDLQTATAMASRLEFLPTVAAMTISIAPMILLPFIYFTTSTIIRGEHGSSIRALSATIYSILFTTGIVFSAPVVVAVCFGYVGAKKLASVAKKRGWKRFAIDFDITTLQPIFAALLVLAIYSGAGWIVPESLTIRGAEPIRAYVVSQDQEAIVYLRGDDKTLVRTKAEQVETQEFCSLGRLDLVSSPLYRIWSDVGTYPECPKEK